MADPDSDDLGQGGADPFDGITLGALLGEAAKTQHFEHEVSEIFEVLEWNPPGSSPQGRMPANVKVRALLERARTVQNSQGLLNGERLEIRYGRKIAIKDGPTYSNIPVDYGGGRRGPLAAGTLGLVIAQDADIGGIKRTGAKGFPELPGRHKLAHGVFVPGIRAGADLDYQVPGQADDLIFIGSDDLSAGLAWTLGDTSTELRGATIKIGANATQAPARAPDLETRLIAAVNAAKTAVVPNDGGLAFSTALALALAGLPPGSAATKVGGSGAQIVTVE